MTNEIQRRHGENRSAPTHDCYHEGRTARSGWGIRRSFVIKYFVVRHELNVRFWQWRVAASRVAIYVRRCQEQNRTTFFVQKTPFVVKLKLAYNKRSAIEFILLQNNARP